MEEKLNQILEEEGFVEKLTECESAADVQKLFASKGVDITLDEVKAIGSALAAEFSDSDEMDEDALDSVAGGAALHRVGLVSAVIHQVGSKRDFFDKRRLHKPFHRWK